MAPPGLSRALFVLELYSAPPERLLGSYAKRTAGPPGPVSLKASDSNAHKTAFEVPFAEMVGVAPGKLKVFKPLSTGVVDNSPLVTEKAFTTSVAPQKYTFPLK